MGWRGGSERRGAYIDGGHAQRPAGAAQCRRHRGRERPREALRDRRGGQGRAGPPRAR